MAQVVMGGQSPLTTPIPTTPLPSTNNPPVTQGAQAATQTVVGIADAAAHIAQIVREQAAINKEAMRNEDNEFNIRKNFLDNAVNAIKEATYSQYNIVICTDQEHDDFQSLTGQILPMDLLNLEVAPGKNVNFQVYVFDTGKYLRHGKWERDFWWWWGESKQWTDPAAMHVHFEKAQTKLDASAIKAQMDKKALEDKTAADAKAAEVKSQQDAEAKKKFDAQQQGQGQQGVGVGGGAGGVGNPSPAQGGYGQQQGQQQQQQQTDPYASQGYPAAQQDPYAASGYGGGAQGDAYGNTNGGGGAQQAGGYQGSAGGPAPTFTDHMMGFAGMLHLFLITVIVPHAIPTSPGTRDESLNATAQNEMSHWLSTITSGLERTYTDIPFEHPHLTQFESGHLATPAHIHAEISNPTSARLHFAVSSAYYTNASINLSTYQGRVFWSMLMYYTLNPTMAEAQGLGGLLPLPWPPPLGIEEALDVLRDRGFEATFTRYTLNWRGRRWRVFGRVEQPYWSFLWEQRGRVVRYVIVGMDGSSFAGVIAEAESASDVLEGRAGVISEGPAWRATKWFGRG
ncbi:uncharacterized protein KY384_005652 [Bacidia gigantensis]|uniref:uncharacterized protein n=1 Tax=Bacidia gigantensis TaxID=2732470 RepID=UPI001D0556A5|nr:uncharacterized protein KY384_005652 [Bacidia gigantensis]KAG8530169.1 hypothetical protein KY384_005652 [Bacidia gigantensis]